MDAQMTTGYEGGFFLPRGELDQPAGHVAARQDRHVVELHVAQYGEAGVVSGHVRLTPDEAIELSGALEQAAHAAWEHVHSQLEEE